MEIQALIEQYKTLVDPELLTIILSMLPILELRFAIPFAISGLELAPIKAASLSIFGNILILIPILFLYKPISTFLKRHIKLFEHIEKRLDQKIRHKFSGRYELFGALALTLFVAIPLPGTGGWTGAFAAYLFDIKPLKALFLIATGIIIAGILVTSIWTGSLIVVCEYIFQGSTFCSS